MTTGKPQQGKGLKPSSGPPREGMITASEYARRNAFTKARMTQFFRNGMPFVIGKDAAGQRDCKYVDCAEADAWRAINCKTTIDGNGRVRGIVEAPTPAGEAPTKPPPPKAAPPSAGASEAISPPTNDPAGPTSAERIQQARARQAEDDARRSHLRTLDAAGKLCDRKAAIDVQAKFAGAIGTQIDRTPADLATVVADMLGVTEHQAYLALKHVARRQREDLARYAADAAREARG